MKNIRRLAGISVLFTFAAMIIALVQFQEEDGADVAYDQIEYDFSNGWMMVPVNGAGAEEKGQESHGEMQKRIEDALGNGEGQVIELPCAVKTEAGGAVIFKNILPQEYAGMTLHFSSGNAAVSVLLDGEVIYQHGIGEDDSFGESSESMEYFVAVPPIFQDGELWIVLTSFQPDGAAVFGDVRFMAQNTVVVGLAGGNITNIVCCLLIGIMAIIMFMLGMIRWRTRQPGRGELYLGLAGLTAGIYYFIGTDTLSIFYGMQEAYEMQDYLVALLPLFLTLYFERNFHTIYPRRFSALLLCLDINVAGQAFLQMLGIRNMEDMVYISKAAMAVVCVTAVVSLVQFDYKNRSPRALLSVLSMLVLLAGEIANVAVSIYSGSIHFNKISQYAMAVFSIMVAAMHTFQIAKEYRANAEKSACLLKEKVREVEQQNTQLVQARHEADAARHEALAANEAKGKFLARMSHEIRTPINAVLGMDEMILRESKEQNIKDYAMDICMAGQTLLSLINDILDFSKIDSGKMEIVPVEYDVSSVIHDLANMAVQRAKGKGLRFQVEVDHTIPSRLYGDDVRIRQVLTNILTNAVKYTHEGTVRLRVQSLGIGEAAVLRFEVEDTGIGIKEEDLPKLFAEFERIEEDRNRNIEGTGLGMSITIQLLALLGSKMQVESVYGKGSKFYFDLEQKVIDHTPIGDFESRVRQLAENYSYGARFLSPDAKVLVVDDNAVNRKVFRNLLKETQIQVAEAAGGTECLKLVQQNHYDLIFLDHMMPDMDGVETFRRMKELADYPCQDTPVIVLTANAVSGAKEKYLSEGFDGFLSKPIVPEKLETMIKEMLPKDLLQKAAVQASGTDAGQEGTDGTGSLEELPQVDGLDWNYAWLHLPDMELLEYTVKEFYGQIDSAAERLEQAYGQIAEPGQLGQYRIQVHAMKSLAATIGIVPLAGVAKLLECGARDGKIDVVMSMTEAFLEEWRSYRQKLQGVFGIEDAAGKEVADYSVVQALVEMVRLSMQEMDVDQADQLMGRLQSYEYPDEMKQNVKKLAQAVTNLDSEETGRLADLLIGQMGQ